MIQVNQKDLEAVYGAECERGMVEYSRSLLRNNTRQNNWFSKYRNAVKFSSGNNPKFGKAAIKDD